MRKHIWLILSFSFFLSSTDIPFLFANELVETKKTSNQISIEFLKQLPENDYILGPGDNIEIIVSREYPELDSEQLIDGEGTIYVPKLYRVFVNGLSVNELNALLNDAFKEFIKYPMVEVKVKEYRPIRIYVEGEVENPGLQTLPGSFSLLKESVSTKGSLNESQTNFFPTVFDAIRESDGITEFSDLKRVKLIRKDLLSLGGGKKETTLNFEDVLKGNNSNNIRIYDGDVIMVPKSDISNTSFFAKAILSNLNPKVIDVTVTGRVNQPGRVILPKASVLTDAFDVAGGIKIIKGPITLLRFNKNGTIDKRVFNYKKRSKRGSSFNPRLKTGDIIFVGESALSASTQIISEVTAPFSGLFSVYGLFKALTN